MPTTTTSSGLNNLAMTGSSAPLFFEIFREVDKAESKDAKIAVLRKQKLARTHVILIKLSKGIV